MGAEQLEESELEPMYQDLRGSLSGKPVGLFGSYGWGDRRVDPHLGRGRRRPPVPVWSLSLSWPDGSPDGDAEAACAALGAALGQCLIFPISIHTGRGSDAPPSLFVRPAAFP